MEIFINIPHSECTKIFGILIKLKQHIITFSYINKNPFQSQASPSACQQQVEHLQFVVEMIFALKWPQLSLWSWSRKVKVNQIKVWTLILKPDLDMANMYHYTKK